MRAPRWLTILIPVLVIGGLVIWRISAKNAEEAAIAAESESRRGMAAAVEIATAQSLPIIETVDAVGTVVSEYSVDLSPRVAGRITYLEVREGDAVRPGQTLVRIDPSQADAGVLGAQAGVNESRSRLAEAEATIQSNRVQIEQAVLQAEAELTNARAALTQTERNLEGRIDTAQAAVRSANAGLNSARALVTSRRAEHESARAEFKNAETYLSRVRSQYEKGYISAQEVDNAETAASAARARVSVAQASVESAQAGVATAQAQVESAQTTVRTAQTSGAAEVRAARARVEQAEAAVKSAKANRAQNPANEANIKALRAGVAASEAQLRSATSQKSDTELASTFDGVVTARNADPGDLASPGSAVLRIESVDSLFVNASIPIEESGRVQKGMPVTVTVEGADTAPVEAVVDQVVPSANAADRQFLVRVRIANQEGTIRPGMFTRVSIEVSRAEAQVAIPSEAVQNGEVTVIDDENKAVKRKVEVGETGTQMVEVLSGLRVGERVVVLSYNPVREGATVNPTAERLSDGTRRPLAPESGNGPGGAPSGGGTR